MKQRESNSIYLPFKHRLALVIFRTCISARARTAIYSPSIIIYEPRGAFQPLRTWWIMSLTVVRRRLYIYSAEAAVCYRCRRRGEKERQLVLSFRRLKAFPEWPPRRPTEKACADTKGERGGGREKSQTLSLYRAWARLSLGGSDRREKLDLQKLRKGGSGMRWGARCKSRYSPRKFSALRALPEGRN